MVYRSWSPSGVPGSCSEAYPRVMATRVLLYELHEVPCEPESNLSRLVTSAMLRTELDDDAVELMPWRTWHTFHTSLYTREHNAFDQGQDPASFRGTPLWDVADDAGLGVGLFGVMQSWPPREFRAGGFYVPDSFARTDGTFPRSLRRFQAFNRAMTEENTFAAESELSPRRLAGVGADLLLRGLTPRSLARGARQMVDERRDARYKARRAAAQVLPCFDVFWRLHRRHQPALSIFFTDHVAPMMHRFWGDSAWERSYAGSTRHPAPCSSRFRAWARGRLPTTACRPPMSSTTPPGSPVPSGWTTLKRGWPCTQG